MKVLIKETQEIKEFSNPFLNASSGQGARDYILMFGDAGKDFAAPADEWDCPYEFLCSGETFDWWEDVILQNLQAEKLFISFGEEFGEDALSKVKESFSDIGGDLDDILKNAEACILRWQEENLEVAR